MTELDPKMLREIAKVLKKLAKGLEKGTIKYKEGNLTVSANTETQQLYTGANFIDVLATTDFRIDSDLVLTKVHNFGEMNHD